MNNVEPSGDAGCYLDDDTLMPWPHEPGVNDPGAVGVSLTLGAEDSAGWFFSLDEVAIGSFTTKFAFEIRNRGGIADNAGCLGGGFDGGDGLAFVIAQDMVSGVGAGLGYEGVDNSVAVEFDTYCNNDQFYADPSANHVGIMINGDATHPVQPTANVPGSFEDGSTWFAWIEYDGTTLAVFVDNQDAKPNMPILTDDLDVAAIIGGPTSRVGFSASSGLAFESFIMTQWEFTGQP